MNEFSLKCVCFSCQSLLLVENDDIMVKFKKNLSLYYTFLCPCCNIENEIKPCVLPISVRIGVLKKFKKGIIYERINV